MDELKGKKVSVVGLGPRTGVSLVRYLCSKGALVSAYDQRKKEELAESLNPLHGLSFHLEAGRSEPTFLDQSDLIVISPGVPIDLPYLSRAKKMGKSVISEVEFSSQRIHAPILAITGTNGKSTTTSLLAAIFQAYDKRVFAGGNLGNPLVDAIEGEWDFIVAEISSFQLEAVKKFHPRVGMVLNISANHLDRHVSLNEYAAVKERIFSNMKGDDVAILNALDPLCVAMSFRIRARVQFFSAKENPSADIWIHGRSLLLKGGKSISLDKFKLLGIHNLENAAAAALAAMACNVPLDVIETGLNHFPGLPHRLETVGHVNGVLYVNDSKSTSPEATQKAIDAFTNPLVLLLGGRSKGASYRELAQYAAQRAKKVILFGEAALAMQRDFESLSFEVCKGVGEAFEAATKEAKAGDVVLFSPANSSFDEFKNFEERGIFFTSLVDKFKQRDAS